jgi:hypothetical protein
MRFFRYGIVSLLVWVTKQAFYLNQQRVAKNTFKQNTIEHSCIPMMTKETDDNVMNSVWGVAEQVAMTKPSGGFGMMKDMLIRATGIPMLTKSTDLSVYENLYSLGKEHYTAHKGRPIWRKVFVKAVIASHFIPCISEETANDVLDTVCAIVEHTVPPEIAARELFSKLLAANVHIPLINDKTEKVVFESLFNIASSMIFR